MMANLIGPTTLNTEADVAADGRGVFSIFLGAPVLCDVMGFVKRGAWCPRGARMRVDVRAVLLPRALCFASVRDARPTHGRVRWLDRRGPAGVCSVFVILGWLLALPRIGAGSLTLVDTAVSDGIFFTYRDRFCSIEL